MSGRPSSRRHLQATVCQAGQRRRALSCAAGAEPRAENRRLPIFEHGEHLPFDPPCAPWHPALHRSDRVVRRLLVVCRVSSRCQGTDRAIDRASPDRSHTVATLKAATRLLSGVVHLPSASTPSVDRHLRCWRAPEDPLSDQPIARCRQIHTQTIRLRTVAQSGLPVKPCLTVAASTLCHSGYILQVER